jgi:hypothetical protein
MTLQAMLPMLLLYRPSVEILEVVELGGRVAPNSLERQNTASNIIRTNLHDVDLTCNPETSMSKDASANEELDSDLVNTYWRMPTPAPLQSFPRAFKSIISI